MMFNSVTEGRECDALVSAAVSSAVVPVDGVRVTFAAGSTVRLQTGDVRTVLSAGDGCLVFNRPVVAPDNCGIWLA